MNILSEIKDRRRYLIFELLKFRAYFSKEDIPWLESRSLAKLEILHIRMKCSKGRKIEVESRDIRNFNK